MSGNNLYLFIQIWCMQLLVRLKKLLSVQFEEDTEITLHEIKEGIRFDGHNLWLLGFAMLMACVGLNNNNITAIIGAMLISPLMGPVTGVAFGVSISDTSIIRQSLKSYSIALFISLVASTIFFLISPFSNTNSILTNYTHPTIFDVMLAFFGGIAGFLGIIKKDGTKVIAGVAVATACMPPLCSAGYGLANQNYEMFIGGIYFYIINSFFIGVGSQLLIRITQLHKKIMVYNLADKINAKWNYTISIIGLLLMLPSIWIAYEKWNQEKLDIESDKYIQTIKKRHPELVIVEYNAFLENGKSYVNISLLNDSSTIHPSILKEANKLNKMNIVWHFVPNNKANDVEQLQLRVKELEEAIHKINLRLK